MDAALCSWLLWPPLLLLLAESASDVVVGMVGAPVIYEKYDGPGQVTTSPLMPMLS